MKKQRENYNKYMREAHRRRYAELRNAAIERLGGRCAYCGVRKRLQFDHVDPAAKVDNVSSLIEKNISLFWEEVDKCQLLCQDCHTKKSINESGKKAAKRTHGTLSSRRYCKCDKCKAAYNAYMRKYKRRYRAKKKLRKPQVASSILADGSEV